MKTQNAAKTARTAEGISAEKRRRMEEASSQKRHWVRLTRTCNNRCVFCLDKDSQDGTVVPYEDVCEDLRRGIRAGCERAILSGGEPTLHPDYTRIVRFAKRLGYRRIQTVTNGRMFAYPDFLEKALAAGLDEITFSMHGHTPELHDAQTRTPGSFRQALAGLFHALRSRRVIVNIDIVINKHNYRMIDTIMDYFIRLGVREFDLLHVTPFGDAWALRDDVFYDPAEGIPHLNRAFAYSGRQDLFIWTNRFPPKYLAAFPELIQNPVKIKDEVRGRMDLFDGYLRRGRRPPCRGARCRHCFIQGLCNELFMTVKVLETGAPASLRAAPSELRAAEPAFFRHAARVFLHGEALEELRGTLLPIPDRADVFLEFQDYTGIESFIAARRGRPLTATVFSAGGADALLRHPGVTLWVDLNKDTFPLPDTLKKHPFSGKIKLFVRNRARLEDLLEKGVDLKNIFTSVQHKRRETVNIPGCLARTPPARIPWFFDLGVLDDRGEISMQKLADVFIEHRYYVFPAGCEDCGMKTDCPGMHVNYLRAFGFKPEPRKRACGKAK